MKEIIITEEKVVKVEKTLCVPELEIETPDQCVFNIDYINTKCDVFKPACDDCAFNTSNIVKAMKLL